jgi:hypothetical protein
MFVVYFLFFLFSLLLPLMLFSFHGLRVASAWEKQAHCRGQPAGLFSFLFSALPGIGFVNLPRVACSFTRQKRVG